MDALTPASTVAARQGSRDAVQPTMKHACASCARRKIRCDRRQPCSNCVTHARIAARRRHQKAGTHSPDDADPSCVYIDLPAPQNRRARLSRASTHADDLLDRLRLYERLLKENGITSPDIQFLNEQQQEPQTHQLHQQPLPRPTSVRSGESSAESRTGSCADSRADNRAKTASVTDSQWIPSSWEAKLAVHSGRSPPSASETVVVSEASPEAVDSWANAEEEWADAELQLWISLPQEVCSVPILLMTWRTLALTHQLRNPPSSAVFDRLFYGHRTAKAPAPQPGPDTPLDLGALLMGVSSNVPVQHPEPRLILCLWQAFVDKVNPLMRIVHVPTTHQMIVDASWNAARAPPATGALMFSIYALALVSLSDTEYIAMFQGADKGPSQLSPPLPSKQEMMLLFRAGAAKCLLAAGVLTTWRVDVLRAFTLFIFSEPDFEVASTLGIIAMHLGLKIGLHLDTGSVHDDENCAGISFFEREMRLRLWWQIRAADVRMRKAVSLSRGHLSNYSCHTNGQLDQFVCGAVSLSEMIELRMPLNINDADLHPAMTGPPVEHVGPSEMLFVRLKYMSARWMSTFTQRVLNQSGKPPTGMPALSIIHRPHMPQHFKDSAITEMEKFAADNCLRHCDKRIPLHAITINTARMFASQLRFHAHHPRFTVPTGQMNATATGLFSQKEADTVFQHAVHTLEMCFACRHMPGLGNSYSSLQLLPDLVLRVFMDIIVYLLCMMRYRTGDGSPGRDTKERIDDAWRLIDFFYDEYGNDLDAAAVSFEEHCLRIASDMGDPSDNREEAEDNGRRLAAAAAYVTALSNLTLEAWEARAAVFAPEDILKPKCVGRLQAQKERQKASADMLRSDIYVWGPGDLILPDEPIGAGWDYLNSFMHM